MSATGQATVNLITLGHVAHGKSSLLHALTGVRTAKHRDEKARNMTIRLGYANLKVFRCPACPPPGCFQPFPSAQTTCPPCRACGAETQFERHFSFVDAPGHAKYAPTVLAGIPNVDAAILLVAANEPCPMPQTDEHVASAAMLSPGLMRNLIVCQNKVDLCTLEESAANKAELVQFLAAAGVSTDRVVPICANLGYNVDVVCQYLCAIPVQARDVDAPPRIHAIRSFDINRPGASVDALCGGVVGGNLVCGVLRPGDVLEIRPGLVLRNGAVTPLRTRVVSLRSEQTELAAARPGLIAIQLTVDPALAKEDRMVGHVLGPPGTLPPVFRRVKVRLARKMKRLCDKAPAKAPQVGERLLASCVSMKTKCTVLAVEHKTVELRFDLPACADIGAKVALMRASEAGQWRLLASAHVVALVPLELTSAAAPP
uniref:protein-synthesizing GTPase n=1 Tax=Marseillevirus LCMAC103 TaxID=2506604 RepID=A0A481YVB6_9VIRU|nr:MAG: translation initiation factor 2 gamma subunit [Marseillevirus LCMAC103]